MHPISLSATSRLRNLLRRSLGACGWGQLTRSEARDAFATFDMWPVTRIQTEPSDMVAAAAYMRRLDLNLRTPDALNIAIAQRLSATLVTFDDRMAHNARLLGVSVE